MALLFVIIFISFLQPDLAVKSVRELEDQVKQFEEENYEKFLEATLFEKNHQLSQLYKEVLKPLEKANEDLKLKDDRELIKYANLLNNKDLSDWLSKSGLTLLTQIVYKYRENYHTLDCARGWIRFRVGFTFGDLKDTMTLLNNVLVTAMTDLKNIIKILSLSVKDLREMSAKHKEWMRKTISSVQREYSSIQIDVDLRNTHHQTFNAKS